MKKALSYQDIYLVPAYSELHTRGHADLSVEFLGRKLRAPWVPSNMSSVINEDLCKWLSENDYPYIMHRFGDTQGFITRANQENWKLISISIGVKQVDWELIRWIVDTRMRVDWITIDVAHGHHVLVHDMIKVIKDAFPPSWPLTIPKIIAGNVATPEGVRDLTSWGTNAVKVGVGGGSVCSTKTRTSFHVPMFTCVQNCAKGSTIPIIADGGVREPGDIVKALVAGTSVSKVPILVMCGNLFAACKDAPGENVIVQAERTDGYGPRIGDIGAKRYHGSASEHQKGERKHVEGFQLELPCNGLTYAEKYQELTESLSSAVSYAGGVNLKAFSQITYVKI